MHGLPENSAPAACCEEQGRDLRERVFPEALCPPVAGTARHLRGPGGRLRLSHCRVGTGVLVMERPRSQVKKDVQSSLNPDGIQHPKGYARLLGSGGEGASALPVIQLVRFLEGGDEARVGGMRKGGDEVNASFSWSKPIWLE